MSAKISGRSQRDAKKKVGKGFSREVIGRRTETAGENENLRSLTGNLYNMLEPGCVSEGPRIASCCAKNWAFLFKYWFNTDNFTTQAGAATGTVK